MDKNNTGTNSIENENLEKTSFVEVSTEVAGGRKELSKACYEHAVGSYKKGSRIDGFVVLCGLFAIGCLAVSVYYTYRYKLDLVFALMIAGYTIIAMFCLIRPLHYAICRLSWNMGFSGRLRLNKKGETARFSDKVMNYVRKKDMNVPYNTMFSGFETEEYFVFHINDYFFVPIHKQNVLEAEKEFENTDLSAFFAELIAKANEEESDNEKEPVEKA